LQQERRHEYILPPRIFCYTLHKRFPHVSRKQALKSSNAFWSWGQLHQNVHGKPCQNVRLHN